jgi:hypothetical protein
MNIDAGPQICLPNRKMQGYEPALWSLARASDQASGAFTEPLGRGPLLAPVYYIIVADYFGFVLKDETC